MRNPKNNDNRNSLWYKGFLTASATISNADNIAAISVEATSTYSASSNPKTYKFTGGAAIGCSSIALLCIIAIYIKYIIDKIRNKNSPNIPTAYLIFLSLSCVLSIIGSILLIADENQQKNSSQPNLNSNLHVSGAVLYAIGKLSNPLLTSLFAAYSLVETSKKGEQQSLLVKTNPSVNREEIPEGPQDKASKNSIKTR